jgi:hypothetical protein
MSAQSTKPQKHKAQKHKKHKSTKALTSSMPSISARLIEHPRSSQIGLSAFAVLIAHSKRYCMTEPRSFVNERQRFLRVRYHVGTKQQPSPTFVD